MSNYATDKMTDATGTPALEVKRRTRWQMLVRFPATFWKHYRLARYCGASRYHSARLAFKFSVIMLKGETR